MKITTRSILLLAGVLTLVACRKEEGPLPSTTLQVIYPDPEPGDIKGFFVLNEANMGSNKASLDYFDYGTGIYSKNIYPERNPDVIKELGDVGNDLQIHGERLYAVINCSNLVEVMDVGTARHIGAVTIPNCRYIVFKDRYAYVSSYAGKVEIDPNARRGYVAKVDTATLQVVATCPVGYQPEEMVVAGDRLYVANSGGYRVDNYDHTVSVIDLNTFSEVKTIETSTVNLHRMKLDRYGQIWVSSRGDHKGTGSKTLVIDSRTDQVTDVLDLLPCSQMARRGDSLYVYCTEWSYVTNSNKISYAIVDVKSHKVLSRNFITDGTDKKITIPYGLAVHPVTGEILVTDAKDYLTPGTIYSLDKNGKKRWEAMTGDIPARIVFTRKQLQPLK